MTDNEILFYILGEKLGYFHKKREGEKKKKSK